jgi:DNA-binding response OmpR family regulator
VIVLTDAGADPVERVRAFERGADDVAAREVYPELLARIRAVLLQEHEWRQREGL